MDSSRGPRSLGLVFAAVLLCGAGAARADKANDSTKKAAASEKQKADAKPDQKADAKADQKADAKPDQKADAKPDQKAEKATSPQPSEPPAPPPVVERKIDPLDAALMQAMATTSAPTTPKKATPKSAAERRAAQRAKNTGGLKGLGKLARGSGKVRLGGRGRSQVPEADHTVRMDLQPLPIAAVREVIKKNAGKLQYCHERLAARGLASNGEVSVNFMVEPKGHVSGVKVAAGGVGARELEQCMKQRIQKWRFPAADAPTPVSYPFVFEVAGTALAN